MSFITAIISVMKPLFSKPMVDPIGQGSPLPMDVARIIFMNLKEDLPSLALVSKKWKALADDKGFREMIRPPQAFGAREWKEYFGVDCGEEPLLPRRIYGDLPRNEGLLTLIPEKVKVTKENGEVEEMLLDGEEAINKLVKNPIKGHKTGYSVDVNPLFFAKNIPERAHWVWVKREYVRTVLPIKPCMPDISEKELSISVFMEYIKTGRVHLIVREVGLQRYKLMPINKMAEEWKLSTRRKVYSASASYIPGILIKL